MARTHGPARVDPEPAEPGAPRLEPFGPFLIARPLRRGGMGEVFVALTPWPSNPLAAVKRLRPDVARAVGAVERFRHEAALAVRLEHPNLVPALDVGVVNDVLYVASELVHGKDAADVADRLRDRQEGAPAAVAIRVALDGLAGLGYVHAARDDDGTPLALVHRDVTPGNLLIGYDGRIRLSDFGLAKSQLSEGSRLTRYGEILGTPHYLAPEVAEGGPAVPASDIYGLGAVLYRFLTGVAPFQGRASEVLERVRTGRPRPLAGLRPDLPGWVIALVDRMLAPRLADRPGDALALGEEVLALADRDGLLVPPEAVGRWLRQLFAAEEARERAERAELLALGPAHLEAPHPGTLVLARAVAATARRADPRSDTDPDGAPLLDVSGEEDALVVPVEDTPAPDARGPLGEGPSAPATLRARRGLDRGVLLFLVGLLVVAAMVGAALAAWLAPPARPSAEIAARAPLDLASARARLAAAVGRLESARLAGGGDSTEGWRAAAHAAAALLSGDLGRAEDHLRAAEAALPTD